MLAAQHKEGSNLKALHPKASFHVFHGDTLYSRAAVCNYNLDVQLHYLTFGKVRLAEALVVKLGHKASIISIDEKATIPLGLPAISKTTRLVMNVAEPIVTSDHIFSHGKQQSIVPTVLCGVNMDPKVSKYATVEVIK